MREGWEYKKLGEVCEIVGRIGFRGYQRTDYVDGENEGAISLSPSNIIDGKLNYKKNTYISWEKYEESPEIQIFVGDVLLVKTASVGKNAIVKELPHKATINPQFVVFKNIKVFNEYLYYCINSYTFQTQIKSITMGSSVPTLSQKALGGLSIPVPPLSEQQRIVSKLDLLTSIIDKQKEQLKELDTLAQSIFYDMFGDPVENEKGWEVKKLGEVFKTSSGGTPSKTHPEYYEGGLIPWVNSGDLHQMFIFDVQKKITQSGVDNSSAKKFPKHTVLLAMYGATVGETSILMVESTTNQAVCGILPSSNIPSIFVYSVLKYSKGYFLKNAAGGAQPNISQGIIKDYKFPLPPLSLQQTFAAKIESIEKQKAAISSSLAETQKLFDYTMDKYFG